MKKLAIDIEKVAGAVKQARAGYKIAAHMGVSRQTITNKLSGNTRLTLDDLNIIADFLGRNPIDFLVIEEGTGIKKAA